MLIRIREAEKLEISRLSIT